MPSADKPSLYERLGRCLCHCNRRLYRPVMTDPRLNANPQVNDAHHPVPPPGFKYLVTEMVCWASGGQQKYTGKSMVESHADLKITAKEWDAFLDDLQQTLDKFAVPAEEQTELNDYRLKPVGSGATESRGDRLKPSEAAPAQSRLKARWARLS